MWVAKMEDGRRYITFSHLSICFLLFSFSLLHLLLNFYNSGSLPLIRDRFTSLLYITMLHNPTQEYIILFYFCVGSRFTICKIASQRNTLHCFPTQEFESIPASACDDLRSKILHIVNQVSWCINAAMRGRVWYCETGFIPFIYSLCSNILLRYVLLCKSVHLSHILFGCMIIWEESC